MKVIVSLLCVLALSACMGIDPEEKGSSNPINHNLWNTLLNKNVQGEKVDYKAFINDSTELNQYLALLSNNHPNLENWTQQERLAYWINAYNAFTVKLIVDHYPLESIKDIAWGIPFINSVWDIEFIEIGGHSYDLNDIEHGILRSQFKEPRIHFAINCASKSCPTLLYEAYTAANLEKQLEEQTRLFVNDSSKNKLEGNTLRLSKIFRWFSSDFETEEQSKIAFIKSYSKRPISDEAQIEFLDYDWSLNE